MGRFKVQIRQANVYRKFVILCMTDEMRGQEVFWRCEDVWWFDLVELSGRAKTTRQLQWCTVLQHFKRRGAPSNLLL